MPGIKANISCSLLILLIFNTIQQIVTLSSFNCLIISLTLNLWYIMYTTASNTKLFIKVCAYNKEVNAKVR